MASEKSEKQKKKKRHVVLGGCITVAVLVVFLGFSWDFAVRKRSAEDDGDVRPSSSKGRHGDFCFFCSLVLLTVRCLLICVVGTVR